MDLLEPQTAPWSWGRIFRGAADDDGRDRFLARLLGLFCEDVVRAWCHCERSRYVDLGRATLWEPDRSCYSGVDFTLQDRATRRAYIADMHCWLSSEGERFVQLTDPAVLRARALDSMAFHRFLAFARTPSAYRANVTPRGWSKPVEPEGAILIWGSAAPPVREQAMAEYGLAEVLTVEDMLRDLQAGAGAWQEHVQRLRSWSAELYDVLAPALPDRS